MSRYFYTLAMLLLTCTVLAAPVPEPFGSGWGNPIDPSRDCKVRRGNGTLTIEMPGADHDYDPGREQFNAPRLLRDFEGNFDMRIRVRIDCRLTAQSTVEGQLPYVSAGFLIILPDNSLITCKRMEYALLRKESGTNSYAVLKKWDQDRRQGGGILDSGWKKDPYLRLEHCDRDVTFSISSDGENWTQLITSVGMPAKLKVGLAAYSTSTEPSKIRFDRLWLTRGKKTK